MGDGIFSVGNASESPNGEWGMVHGVNLMPFNNCILLGKGMQYSLSDHASERLTFLLTF